MSVTGLVVALVGLVAGRSHAPEAVPRIPPPPRLPTFDSDLDSDLAPPPSCVTAPRFGDTLPAPPPAFDS